MEAEPVQFLWRRFEENLDPARNALAQFIGARPSDLVFVTNATNAVNAVVRSLKLRPGDRLLTTNHDYNACHNVLIEAARASGAQLELARVPFPCRGQDEVLEAVMSSVKPRTRLALIDHVTSDTAMVFPVERLVRELGSRGVDVLVDGAHAPGMLPLNVSRLKPAWYTGNLHKWVCAPKGAAFLWAREDKQADLQPSVISHGNNRPRHGHTPFQDRFDWAGTFDPSAWFCVPAAIEWMERLFPGGWPELRRRNHDLAVRARRLLCRHLETEAPCPEAMLGAMATLILPGRFQGLPKIERIDAEQQRLYDRFRIELPFMRFGSPERRWLRISAQAYNSMADYAYLADCLQAL
jgi:isopenicillin-N epimerase